MKLRDANDKRYGKGNLNECTDTVVRAIAQQIGSTAIILDLLIALKSLLLYPLITKKMRDHLKSTKIICSIDRSFNINFEYHSTEERIPMDNVSRLISYFSRTLRQLWRFSLSLYRLEMIKSAQIQDELQLVRKGDDEVDRWGTVERDDRLTSLHPTYRHAYLFFNQWGVFKITFDWIGLVDGWYSWNQESLHSPLQHVMGLDDLNYICLVDDNKHNNFTCRQESYKKRKRWIFYLFMISLNRVAAIYYICEDDGENNFPVTKWCGKLPYSKTKLIFWESNRFFHSEWRT